MISKEGMELSFLRPPGTLSSCVSERRYHFGMGMNVQYLTCPRSRKVVWQAAAYHLVVDDLRCQLPHSNHKFKRNIVTDDIYTNSLSKVPSLRLAASNAAESRRDLPPACLCSDCPSSWQQSALQGPERSQNVIMCVTSSMSHVRTSIIRL